MSDDFQFDPDKGTFLASFGPKGTGKSELNTRLFKDYPYNGLLIDFTQDVDKHHEFTEPITPELQKLAAELGAMREEAERNKTDLPDLGSFTGQLLETWRGDPPRRYRKYRIVPNFVAKNWLQRSDDFVGLAYLIGHSAVFLDEIGEQAPAHRTPPWTRQMLRVGRHQHCSMFMAGPRPTDLDPSVLNQADVVTVHGQLHELDVKRMAKHLHLSDVELMRLINNLQRFKRADSPEQGVGEFLAYFKASRELGLCDPLPPRRKRDGHPLSV